MAWRLMESNVPNRINGPGQVVSIPVRSYTHAFREAFMSTQDATTRGEIKRNQLKELVSKLGIQASPSEIREMAYRVGLGQINGNMLVHVRNELWPNRPRRSAGRPKGISQPAMIRPSLVDAILGTCPKCGSQRTRAKSNSKRKDGSIRRRHQCYDCKSEYYTVSQTSAPMSNKRYSRVSAGLDKDKQCRSCNKVLPIDCFGFRETGSIYRRSSCRECLNRKRSDAQLHKVLSDHGMTHAEYEEMLARQAGACAICGVQHTGNRKRVFNIDHCHKTGIVRGLLCDKCNLGIGHFDDADSLEAAAAYVRRHTQEVATG